MRSVLLALALTLGAASGAFAGTMENAFGNTFVIRAPNGDESHWRYSADGTYSMSAGAVTATGTWTQSGSEVCVTPAGSAQNCYQLPPEEKRVGDSWAVPGASGETTITIVEGH